MKQNPLTGYLMILLSAIGFGSYGVWSKFIGPEFGIFYQGWVRSALVLLVLIPIALLTKSFKPIKKTDLKWISIPVLFGIGTQAPLYYAFNHMDIGTSTLVFYALFLITSYVVGKIFLGEKITKPKIASLVLAFLGLLCIFGISVARFSLLAFFLAAANGIASGGEVSTTKKSSHKYSSVSLTVYVWVGILATHLPLSLLFGERQVPFAFTPIWFSMIAFAIAGLVSFWLVIEGYKHVDASIGGLIGLMEIVFGIVFGIFIFHEHLTLSVVLGGGLIMFAAMLPDLIALSSKRRKKGDVGIEAPIVS